MVASILFGAMFITRRRNYRIFRDRNTSSPILPGGDASEHLLDYESDGSDRAHESTVSTKRFTRKKRSCCGRIVRTPNTARYRNNFHSRVLQRFPFLIEMMYWVINYAFYRMTSVTSQALFAKSGIWNVAKSHGIAVLEAEERGMLSFLFPVRERDVQQWFMHGHQSALSALNKAYALIHIPGTVG